MRVVRLTFLIAVGIFAAPQSSWAENEDALRYYQSSIIAYENLDYEKALLQLEKAQAKVTSPDDEQRIHLLKGIVLADMGRNQPALIEFGNAFSLEPGAVLPVETSPKVQALAQQARERVRKLLPTAPKVTELPSPAKLCAEADALMVRIWGTDVRKKVLEQLTQSARRDIVEAAPVLVKRMDDWATSWVDHSLATCVRGKLRREISEQAFGIRSDCLAQNMEVFAELIRSLLHDEPGPGDAVLSVTSRLPRPEECTQNPRPGTTVSLALSDDAAKVRSLSAKAIVLHDVGRSEAALPVAEEAYLLARKTSSAALKANVAHLVGRLRSVTGNLKGAQEAYGASMAFSREAGEPKITIRTLISLITFYSFKMGDFKNAERSQKQAVTLLKNESDTLSLMVELDRNWGPALERMGRPVQSERILRRGLANVRRLEPSTTRELQRIELENMLGTILFNLERRNEAKVLFKSTIDDTIRLWGTQHKSLILYYSNLAAIVGEEGDLNASAQLFRSAIDLAEAAKWPAGKAFGSYIGLAEVLLWLHQVQSARLLAETALSFVEKHFGPDSEPMVGVLLVLGAAVREDGAPAGALIHHLRAIEIARRGTGGAPMLTLEVERGRDLLSLNRPQELKPVVSACQRETKNRAGSRASEAIWCAYFEAAFGQVSGSGENKLSALRRWVSRSDCKHLACVKAQTAAKEWLENKVQP